MRRVFIYLWPVLAVILAALVRVQFDGVSVGGGPNEKPVQSSDLSLSLSVSVPTGLESAALGEVFDSLSISNQIEALSRLSTMNAGELKEVLKAFSWDNAWAEYSIKGYYKSYLKLALLRFKPEVALNLILSVPDHGSRINLLHSIFEEWATEDLGIVISIYESLEDKNLREGLRDYLAEKIKEREPNLFYNLSYEYWRWSDDTESLFKGWTRIDPEQALLAIDQIENLDDRATAYVAYYSQLFLVDPKASLEAISKMGSIGDMPKQAVLGMALAGAFEENPGFVLKWLESSPDESIRRDLFTYRAHEVVSHAPYQLFDWARSHASGTEKVALVTGCIAEIVKRDRARAEELIAQLENPSMIRKAKDAYYESWAINDPKEFLRWYDQNLGKEGVADVSNKHLYSALSPFHWDSENAEQMEFINSIQSDFIKAELMNQQFRAELDDLHPLEALQHLEQWEDVEDSNRNSIRHGILYRWVHRDRDAFIQYVDENPSVFFGTVSRYVVEEWSKRDMTGALNWAIQLDERNRRDDAVSGAIEVWCSYDLEGAATWIDKMDPGKTQDRVIGTFVSRVEKVDPQMGLEWAASIQNDNQRINLLQQVLYNWSEYAKQDAYEAFKALPLKDSDREQFSDYLE